MKLTRKEVSSRWHVSVGTIQNWSNGFYYRGKQKIFYFPTTKDKLSFTRTELGQPMFTPRDVRRWVDALSSKAK